MFVLRRTRSAPLLPASLLLAVLMSVTVTTGLAGFAGRALPAITALVATHDEALIDLADEVLRLEDGRVLAQEPRGQG